MRHAKHRSDRLWWLLAGMGAGLVPVAAASLAQLASM